MQRREFLAVCVTASTAGCLGTLTTDSDNPWNKSELTVSMSIDSAQYRDLSPLIDEALNYWEKNSERFADFEISFEFKPNTDDADIHIRLVDKVVNCGQTSGDAIGCFQTDESSDTGRIQIEDGYPDDMTLITIKHELGHALTLGHDDEPGSIMSHDANARIPNYDQKNEIMETYSDSIDTINKAISLYEEAEKSWDNREFGDAADTFEQANEKSRTASDQFRDAEDKTISLGNNEAKSICNEAARKATKFADAMLAIKRAAEAYDQGNDEQGEKKYDRYSQLHTESNQLTIRDTGVLSDVLNLPDL